MAENTSNQFRIAAIGGDGIAGDLGAGLFLQEDADEKQSGNDRQRTPQVEAAPLEIAPAPACRAAS